MPRNRQLAAIMFTDIAGYTALMQQNEKRAIKARNKHRYIFKSVTKRHHGRILQYFGDGTLSIFNSAIDAVKCAIEMQQGFRNDPAIPIRIGIHTGDIILNEEEIIGDSVNIASRIESLAIPGSVFVSAKVHDEIRNQASIKAVYLDEYKLKNIDKPVGLYAISNKGLVVPKPGEVKGTMITDNEVPCEEWTPERVSELDPETFARMLVNMGIQMSQILTIAARKGIMPQYAEKLLAVMGGQNHNLQTKLPIAS